jgi:hypothetical protein
MYRFIENSFVAPIFKKIRAVAAYGGGQNGGFALIRTFRKPAIQRPEKQNHGERTHRKPKLLTQ